MVFYFDGYLMGLGDETEKLEIKRVDYVEIELLLDEMGMDVDDAMDALIEELHLRRSMRSDDEWDTGVGGDYPCQVCGDGFELNYMQIHHTSYEPEETLQVCRDCHRRIHHEDGYHDDLIPDMRREDAESVTIGGSSELEKDARTRTKGES